MNDAAAGVFVLYPNALYYAVALATRRLGKYTEACQVLVTEFLGYVEATGRHVLPVNSLSALANSRVALQELASSSSSREGGITDITSTSAFDRFNNNTQRFLDEVGGNVKVNGDIAPTPEEARSLFADAYTAIQDGFIDVLRRTSYIANAQSDFEGMKLPATLFGSVVTNAEALVTTEYNALNAMTPSERLSVIRTTVLNMLAARSAVRGFGNLAAPGLFYSLTGMGHVFVDSAHTPEHAVLTGDVQGPFNILGTANQLDVLLDGATSITTTLSIQPSFVPAIEGMSKDFPIDIAHPVVNRFFSVGIRDRVGLDDVFEVTRSLIGVDAYDVATDINSVIPATTPLLAEPYCNPLRYAGNFNITPDSPTTKLFTAVNPTAVDLVALGVTTSDFLIVRDVTSGMDRAVYAILTVNTDSLVGQVVHGAEVDEADKTAYISNGALGLRLRITDHTDSNISKPDYRLQALQDKMSIYIPSTCSAGEEQQRYGVTTLGFLPLMEAMARSTTAAEVATSYNAQPGAAVAGVTRTRASTSFVELVPSLGRSYPSDPRKVVAYKYQGTADVAGGIFTCTGALAAGVAVGDRLVVRTSSTPSFVNAQFNVTVVSDGSITAVPVIALPPFIETGISIEVGQNFPAAYVQDATVLISGNITNNGEYIVAEPQVIPFEFILDKPLTFYAGLGNLPVLFSLSIGRYVMQFESLKEDVTASIAMGAWTNPASAFFNFFAAEPQQAWATTKYYHPPSLPKGLSEGDMFEVNTVDYTPTFVGVITDIDTTLGIVELDNTLSVLTNDLSFTVNSPIPYARIRRQHTDAFTLFSEALTGWMNGLDLDKSFMDLTRALNSILVNANPAPSQVNDARTQLTGLNNVLLSLAYILDGYDAPVIEQVDALVKGLLEKGADRAVDILLECRFSEFFGLSQNDSNYSTFVQEGIKDVANQDLPIRKFDRTNKNAAEQALLASWDEADFEFSQGDADPEADVG
jgi:hypothetical protein